MQTLPRRLLTHPLILLFFLSGCADVDPSKHVVFLDGAGHFGAGSRVRSGLRASDYDGEFQGFVWTSFLLWGADHIIAARSTYNARRLARRIQTIRHEHPHGFLALAGLSAGSAVIVNALERLPNDVSVDSVVLFQPSISATHNLSAALTHVNRRLYATSSRRDSILASLVINADGLSGPPAGRTGFRIPLGLSQTQRSQYRKVVNLPWQTKYRKYGWRGGHLDSTAPRFVQEVIAPRILPKPTPDESPKPNDDVAQPSTPDETKP